jgi:hypothetical protein
MRSLRRSIDSMFSEPIAEAIGRPPARVRAITNAERQAREQKRTANEMMSNSDAEPDIISDIVSKAKQALAPDWDNGYEDMDTRDDALIQHAVQHAVQHMQQHAPDVPTPDASAVDIVKRNAKVTNGYRPTILEQAARRLTGEM